MVGGKKNKKNMAKESQDRLDLPIIVAIIIKYATHTRTPNEKNEAYTSRSSNI